MRLWLFPALLALLAACNGGGGSASSSLPVTANRPATGSEQVLHSFQAGRDGSHPEPVLIRVRDSLYGTTIAGGSKSCEDGCGTIFNIGASGSGYGILFRFAGNGKGARPKLGLVESRGMLYGASSSGGDPKCEGYYGGCGLIFEVRPSGMGYHVLHAFAGGADDGAAPYAIVVANKTLYGVALAGGSSSGSGCDPNGCGVLFEVDIASGKERVLHHFHGAPGDGTFPDSLIDVNGTLYGTTEYGGGGGCEGNGCGTLFEMSTSGSEHILYSFHGFYSGSGDGWFPLNVIEVKGTFYGVTGYGGAYECGQGSGCGTVFKTSNSGSETVLYRFQGGADGENPDAVTDVNGTLYGTTEYGGGGSECGGCGTIFSASTSGGENVLYRFAGGSDGANPANGLTNVNGTLFGTTYYGGTGRCSYLSNLGCGTVFKFTP
jgi:uncharacterized repeat protein (TIGR03803 family)